MGWTPRTVGDTPTIKSGENGQDMLNKTAPGQPLADKATSKYYTKYRTNPGQSQPAWQAKDTGVKGQLNDV
jgi:hypothetical protein